MDEKTNYEVAQKMLQAINERKFEIFDSIMAERFSDHHPELGEGISSRSDYVKALMNFVNALDIKATLENIFVKENYTVVNGTMKGIHKTEFFGIKPSGNALQWDFIEVYRLENGQIVERWSLDDTFSLLQGMNVKL